MIFPMLRQQLLVAITGSYKLVTDKGYVTAVCVGCFAGTHFPPIPYGWHWQFDKHELPPG